MTSSSPQGLLPFLRNTAIVLVIVAVLDVGMAFVAKKMLSESVDGERLYRIYSPIYHHGLVANKVWASPWGPRTVEVATNSLGFRDLKVRDVPLKSESPRLLFMGDSFTEGSGIDYKDTFAAIVAERLAPHGVEVLNAAVMSYAPSIYYAKTKHLLEDVGLQFSEMVVFIDISDIQDDALNYKVDDTGKAVSARTTGSSSYLSWFLRTYSLIARLCFTLADAYEAATAPPLVRTGRERALWTVDDAIYQKYGALGVANTQHNMGLLVDLLERHHIPLTIVVHPWPDQVVLHDLDSKQVQIWSKFAEEKGVKLINLFPVFINSEDAQKINDTYYIEGDVHWNEAGHKLVADTFMRARTSSVTAVIDH